MTNLNKTFFIANLKVVTKEKAESRFNRSHVEELLNEMNIGASQEIIVAGNPTTGTYRVNTYKKVNDVCVKVVATEVRG